MSGPGQKDIRQKVCTWLHLIIVYLIIVHLIIVYLIIVYLIIVYLIIVYLIIVYLIIVYMGASPGISWHQLPNSDKLPWA